MLPRSCCCPLTEVPDWGGLQDPCPRMQPYGDALTFPKDGAASLCSALQGTKGRWALCCCLCSPRRCGLLSVPGPCWSSPGPAAPKQGCGPVVPCLPVLLYQSAWGAAPTPLQLHHLHPGRCWTGRGAPALCLQPPLCLQAACPPPRFLGRRGALTLSCQNWAPPRAAAPLRPHPRCARRSAAVGSGRAIKPRAFVNRV